MGFEFKIVAKFTDKEIKDIHRLFEQHKKIDKISKLQNKEFFEFRNIDNQGELPNLFITFENDGIYICQNVSSNIWTDLDELKTYLNKESIEHEILDYAD